jgi:hypothetical protein
MSIGSAPRAQSITSDRGAVFLYSVPFAASKRVWLSVLKYERLVSYSLCLAGAEIKLNKTNVDEAYAPVAMDAAPVLQVCAFQEDEEESRPLKASFSLSLTERCDLAVLLD